MHTSCASYQETIITLFMLYTAILVKLIQLMIIMLVSNTQAKLRHCVPSSSSITSVGLLSSPLPQEPAYPMQCDLQLIYVLPEQARYLC
jgi:hypothetical protein